MISDLAAGARWADSWGGNLAGRVAGTGIPVVQSGRNVEFGAIKPRSNLDKDLDFVFQVVS